MINGINEITRIASGQTAATKANDDNFQSTFNNLLQEVQNTQKNADNLTLQFMSGSMDDMHQVVFAMEQSQLTLQLAVQVRNKIVDAYQEVMRMQV